jgi:L-threonylcarbamoyladenylate synthase
MGGEEQRSAVTRFSESQVSAAAAAILRGEIVAYPTETYYGFAVRALDVAALERLFALKGRGENKASALVVADLAMFGELCAEIPAPALALAKAHWPGPFTLAVPARSGLPPAIVTDGCVAARVSSHPLAHALVSAVGEPITATSANPSGEPPIRRSDGLGALFPDGGFHVLDGGETPGGSPSTLVRVRGGQIEVLRKGPIAV